MIKFKAKKVEKLKNKFKWTTAMVINYLSGASLCYWVRDGRWYNVQKVC